MVAPFVDRTVARRDRTTTTVEPDDVELIGKVRAGDREALAALFERHWATVIGASRRFAFADMHAEDVAQHVFAELWERPERFDPTRGALPRYLVMIARARAIDLTRADIARRRRETCSERGTSRDVVSEIVGRLEGEEVSRLVRSLPKTEREAIVLAFFGGHSYRRVAELLGLPEGTVKSRIRTGLARLRGAIKP